MTIQRIIPKWCRNHYYIDKDKTKRCCYCNREDIVFQQGDGKVIHSLCMKCFIKFKHFCGGEKLWESICAECQKEVGE